MEDNGRSIDRWRAAQGLGPLGGTELKDWTTLVRHASSDPVSFLLDCFAHHDIVLVGEAAPSQQGVQLWQEVLPRIADRGVTHVAAGFLCTEDQHDIDDLVTARSFDEQAATEMLFRWGMRTGALYREHLSLMSLVWETNRWRDPHTPPLRLLALDARLDYESCTDAADLTTPEAWSHLRPNGSLAETAGRIVHREVVARGEKALLLVSTLHAVSRWRRPAHPRLDGVDGDVRAGAAMSIGNQVFAAVADRCVTVQMAGPFPGRSGGTVPLADGLLDAVVAGEDGPPWPVAVDLTRSPLHTLPCRTAHGRPLVHQVAHGWIYLDPPAALTGPTPLTGILDDRHTAEARRLALPATMRRPSVTTGDLAGWVVDRAAKDQAAWTGWLRDAGAAPPGDSATSR